MEKVGYIQSLSIGVLPVAPILGSAVAFILHTALGNELDTSKVLYCNVLYCVMSVTFLKCK